MAFLEIRDVTSGYGEVQILWGTSMALLKPWQGSIWFDGRDISKLPAHEKAEMGVILVPKGRHGVHICMRTACHVRGAARVLDMVQSQTGIKPGETDLDLKFSLEVVNCLGCCALGPVMEIDGKTYGKMTPGDTSEVLKNYE